MGSSMKKYILISGFCLTDNNRGTAALAYGALAFLRKNVYIKDGQEVAFYTVGYNPFKNLITKVNIEKKMCKEIISFLLIFMLIL